MSDESPRRIVLTPASSIRPRRVQWLWTDRVALGTLALLAGREGTGKSSITAWLIAQVTRGTLPGEHHGEARAVFVCASEDDWAATIVPRLIASGADLDLVHRVEVQEGEIHTDLSLPRDVLDIERLAIEVGADLLVLDPLISRLGSLDTHKDADVRQSLEPLVRSAQRAGLAVLGLIHHNKARGADPMNAVMGSRAFTAVARSVHTVVVDPEDEGLRVFSTGKNNLGPAEPDLPPLAFRVEPVSIPTDDADATTTRVEWTGEHAPSAVSVMRRAHQSPDDRTKTDDAGVWLLNYLTEHGGSAESSAVKDAAKTQSISLTALQNGRGRVGVVSVSEGGYPRRTVWQLQSSLGETTSETTGTTETTEPSHLSRFSCSSEGETGK